MKPFFKCIGYVILFVAGVFAFTFILIWVEVVDIETYVGEYTDDYSPMVRRLDEPDTSSRTVVPKHKAYNTFDWKEYWKNVSD